MPELSAPAPDDRLDEAEALEAGRHLFAQPCRFLLGVAALHQLPEAGLPEVAFAGRSNVGKSSLLNALTGQHQLARISNTPGRTQQINLFELGGRLILADLPGYGYARAPKDVVARWNALLRAYLRGRSVLRLACILIDARHGLKDSDREFMAMLAEAALAYRVVLTKADLVGAAALEDLVLATREALASTRGAHPQPIVTSARTGRGMPELRAALAELAEDA